jgi:hypothetical protein
MRTLVTYPQFGHSYAISPGSPARASMLSTSSIPVAHLVQASARRRLLLMRSDTIRRLGQGCTEPHFSIVANARSASWLRATKTKPLPRPAGRPGGGPGSPDPQSAASAPPASSTARGDRCRRVHCRDLPLRFSVCHPTYVGQAAICRGAQVGSLCGCGKTSEDQGRYPTVDYHRASHLRGLRVRLGHCRRPARQRLCHCHLDRVSLPSRTVRRLCL